MNIHQSIMLQMLRLAVAGDAVGSGEVNAVVERIRGLGDAFDWLELIRVSASQTVLGLVWSAIESRAEISSLLPFEYKLEWFGQNRKIVERNKDVNKALSQIVRALDEEGIKPILLKGQGCASYYPNPMNRNSGDIDLLVGKDNFYKAHECLKAAGLVGEWIHEDVLHGMLSCQGVTLEIHKYPAFLAGKNADNALQDAVKRYLLQENADCHRIQINGEYVALLPVELNAVYTFIHMFRHFVGSGIKLRQVMDWLLMCKAIKDERLVAQYVKDFCLENGWKVFAQMAVEIIGVPADQVPLYEANYSKKAEKVLDTLMNGELLDLTTEKNPTLWKKLKAVARLYSAHFRCFSVFPKESMQFLWVVMKINARKYLLREMK